MQGKPLGFPQLARDPFCTQTTLWQFQIPYDKQHYEHINVEGHTWHLLDADIFHQISFTYDSTCVTHNFNLGTETELISNQTLLN